MAQDPPHTIPETIDGNLNSRSLKYRKNRKLNPNPSLLTTTVNKSTVASLESLPVKQDQIVKTKFTVKNDLKLKTRKNKELDEPIIDTPEFKLLCKLFVPLKFLIHNDKIAVNQLSTHLPLLIPDAVVSNTSRCSLNFELHLFLSSIVTHSIISWYPNKLNTDNLEFVRNIYNMLSHFAKDLINRLSITLRDGLLPLINELSSIINNHIKGLVSGPTSEHNIKFVDEYFRENMNRNIIKNADKDVNKILEEYLSDKHVIFENMGFQTTSSENLSEKQQSEPDRILYFRLIAKGLLTISFQSNIDSDISQSTPTTSHITMTLLTILIADLIFGRLFTKIASPQFLLKTILNDTIDMISDNNKNVDLQNKDNGPRTIGSIIYTIYNNITRFILNMHNISDICGSYNSTNVLQCSLFQLIDTITDFSSRKPLLSSFIHFSKRIIMANKSTARIFDSISKWLIYSRIARSEIVSDEFCCKMLRILRESIFRDNEEENGNKNIEKEQTTVRHLSCKVLDLLSNQLPDSVVVGRTIANSFRYSNETDEDLKRSIYKFLIIFNYDISSMDNNSINETCLLNQLFMIQWIDCILSNLYPELMKYI